jgi:hypothetical protein
VVAGGPTVTLYDAFGANFFGASDPGPAVRGLNYIGGGNNRAVSAMTQTVDASGDGTIDEAPRPSRSAPTSAASAVRPTPARSR